MDGFPDKAALDSLEGHGDLEREDRHVGKNASPLPARNEEERTASKEECDPSGNSFLLLRPRGQV